jgi:TusA-related sulfurtransferase
MNSEPYDKIGDTYYVDAKDLKCPMPVLTAKKLLEDKIWKGEKLVIQVTDPSFEIDFFVMCGTAGYTLLGKETTSTGLFVFTIQK